MKFVSPSLPSAKIKELFLFYFFLHEIAIHIPSAQCSLHWVFWIVVIKKIAIQDNFKWELSMSMAYEELLDKVLGNFMVYLHKVKQQSTILH